MKTTKIFRHIRNMRGFSIAEMTLVAGLVTVLILTGVTFIQMAITKQKEAQNAAFDSVMTTLMGANFPKTIEASQVSQDFLNLPISRNCGGNETVACLRYLDTATGTLSDPTPSQLPSSFQGNTFQFFRDHLGDLDPNLPVTKSDAQLSKAFYTYTTPSSTKNLPANHSVYATWPLTNATSEPFPILARINSIKFLIPGFSATSSAIPGSWMYAQVRGGVATSSEINVLIGQPVIVYNPLSPQYYAIKVIQDVRLCSTNMSACQSLVPTGFGAAVVASDVRLELTDFDSSLNQLLPNPASIPWGSQNWMAISTNERFFPDISPSINESSITFFLGGGFDPRVLLHYFHASGIKGDVLLAPVALGSYRLTPASAAGKFNLVRDMYLHGSAFNSKRTTVVEEVAGPIVFARKLGSSEMRMLVFDPAKRSPAAVTAGKFLSGVSQTFAGGMKSESALATTMERRKVNYPKNCEMTFSTESTCGDSDVANYYNNTKPNEDNANGKSTFKIVLGYWVERVGAETGVPKPGDCNGNCNGSGGGYQHSGATFPQGTWFAMGYDDIQNDTSQVGMRMINSNEHVSGNKLLQDEVDRVTSLLRFAPATASYRFYSTIMICNTLEDSSGTTSDTPYDNYSAGVGKCQAPLDLTNPALGIPSSYTAPVTGACPAKPTAPCTSPTWSATYDSSGACSWIFTCPTGGAGGAAVAAEVSAGGGGCFVAGTEVSMSDGTRKPIEKVQKGELVRSFDENLNSFYISKVVQPIVHPKQKQILHHFEFENGTRLTSNEEHPFYILEAGGWLRAWEIAALYAKHSTLTFLSENGTPTRLKRLALEEKYTKVYNLQVEGIDEDVRSAEYGRGHAFMANGIVSHNIYMSGVQPACN